MRFVSAASRLPVEGCFEIAVLSNERGEGDGVLGAEAGEPDRGGECGDPGADDADLHGCPIIVLTLGSGCRLRAERGRVPA